MAAKKISEREAEEAFREAFSRIQRSVKTEDIREALEEERPGSLIRRLKEAGLISAALLAAWKPLLSHFTYFAQKEIRYWEWTSKLLPGSSKWAQTWLKQYGLSKIKDLSAETLDGLRAVLDEALERGENPLVAARRIRPLIGLTERQARAVDRFYADLLESGISRTKAKDRARKLADKYLRQRAETIARTELIAAENGGRLEAWRRAQKAKLIGKESEKEWVTAFDERTCPICAQVDGVRVKLDENFPIVNVPSSPAHPRCRCSINLIPSSP